MTRFIGIKLPAILISGFIILLGLMTIAFGAYKTYEAILFLLQIEEGKPGIALIEALDIFLVSLVILILGGGIFKLFVGDEDTFKNIPILSKLKSFLELKILLWETLLLMLTIWATMDFAAFEVKEFGLENLILPASILILAAALRLVKGNFMGKGSGGIH